MMVFEENQQKINNPILSLDMQIAFQIVKMFNIFLVRDPESNNLIPYYYQKNRYISDQNFNTIKGFIKEEIVSLFNYLLDENPDSELFRYFHEYFVTEQDLSEYIKVGYINRLTTNIVKDIRDLNQLIKNESDFDSDPYLINCLNGIINIKTKELYPHSPDFLIRNIVNANYLQTTIKRLDYRKSVNIIKMPSLFQKIIREALLDKTKSDIENREITQSFMEILASFLIGNNEHKLVYILLGLPNTGKSTLLDVLLGIFNDYGITFNNTALMQSSRTSNDIRPDLIALKGKRLLVGSEANKSGKFDNALVKQISGNDQISIRKPHRGNMVTFTITGKLMLATNYCPQFSDLDDQAFLNRIVLIDFNNIPSNIDTSLKEKLLTPESRDEIFTYLVHTAHKIFMSKNIFIHERFKANKQRIMVNQNSTVSLFWKTHIRAYSNYSVPVRFWSRHPISVLYSIMYQGFCKNINVNPLSLEAFAKEFKAISDTTPLVTWKKGESNNFYVGFDVVDGEVENYKSVLITAMADCSQIDDSNKFFS